MVRTRLVALRTAGPKALTHIFLVAGGMSGEASKRCCLAANRAACVNLEFSIKESLQWSTRRSMSAGDTRYFFW